MSDDVLVASVACRTAYHTDQECPILLRDGPFHDRSRASLPDHVEECEWCLGTVEVTTASYSPVYRRCGRQIRTRSEVTVMPCERCGGVVELTDSEGGTTSGSFVERYRCLRCGATGRVSGDAGEPAQRWRRSGAVFGGDPA